jgi:hypothetical protein
MLGHARPACHSNFVRFHAWVLSVCPSIASQRSRANDEPKIDAATFEMASGEPILPRKSRYFDTER